MKAPVFTSSFCQSDTAQATRIWLLTSISFWIHRGIQLEVERKSSQLTMVLITLASSSFAEEEKGINRNEVIT
jgi:hypothetical protein